MFGHILTHEELLEFTSEEIIRYILTFTGYNDIIHIVKEEIDLKFTPI